MSDITDRMQEAARACQIYLPPGTGFVLLGFDFKPGGRMEYVSNGRRSDVVNAMREFIDKATEESFGKHIRGGEFDFDERITDMRLWAWVGEDEMGSAQFGLKQAIVPAGCIPMVACVQGNMEHQFIKDQLAEQGRKFHKTISLVRFCFERVEAQVP